MYRYIHKNDLNDYEIENKRLSYYNLFYKDESMILCNNIADDWEDLEVMNGDIDNEIYQYYIIDDSTAQRLIDNTDEIILYHNRLDIYILGVCHYGTSWQYVLTDFELVKCNDEDMADNWYKAIKIEHEEDEDDDD